MKRNAVSRSFAIVDALACHVVTGLSNAELAAGLRESPVNVCRDMATLESLGLVQRLDTGRWILSPQKWLAYAVSYQIQTDKARRRLEELNHRVMASAASLGASED